MAWCCDVCTFINLNATFLACGACGSERGAEKLTLPKRPTRPPPKLPPASTAPAPAQQQKSPSPEHVLDEKLRPIYEELVETEKTYVDELETIIVNFVKPLRLNSSQNLAGCLSEADIKSVFCNMEEIYRYNATLKDSLVLAIQVASPLGRLRAICDAFELVVPYLKTYAHYAVNYDRASLTLKRIEEENFRFGEFLKEVSLNAKVGPAPLESFLIKPIQRICKYPLFFHTMLKQCEPDSDAAIVAILKHGLELATQAAETVNAEKARAEESVRAFDVSQRMEGLADVIVKPGRRYLGEWRCLFSEGNNSLTKKRRSITAKSMLTNSQGDEKKPRACLLFNDVLIVAKEIGPPGSSKLKYELRLWMSLDEVNVTNINPNDPRVADANATNPSESQSSGGENDGMSRYRHAFRLPLDLVHVASQDLRLNKEYRDKQAHQPRFIKLKKSPLMPPDTSTIITSYTMWFRSSAERGRVHALLTKAVQAKTGPPEMRRAQSEGEQNTKRAILRSTSADQLQVPQSPIRHAATRSSSTEDFGMGFEALSLSSTQELSKFSVRDLKTMALQLGINTAGLEKSELADLIFKAQLKRAPFDVAHLDEPKSAPVVVVVKPRPRPPPPPPPPKPRTDGANSAPPLPPPTPVHNGYQAGSRSNTSIITNNSNLNKTDHLVSKWFGDEA